MKKFIRRDWVLQEREIEISEILDHEIVYCRNDFDGPAWQKKESQVIYFSVPKKLKLILENLPHWEFSYKKDEILDNMPRFVILLTQLEAKLSKRNFAFVKNNLFVWHTDQWVGLHLLVEMTKISFPEYFLTEE